MDQSYSSHGKVSRVLTRENNQTPSFLLATVGKGWRESEGGLLGARALKDRSLAARSRATARTAATLGMDERKNNPSHRARLRCGTRSRTSTEEVIPSKGSRSFKIATRSKVDGPREKKSRVARLRTCCRAGARPSWTWRWRPCRWRRRRSWRLELVGR